MAYQMRCADAGAAACNAKVKARTAEEFRAKLISHLRGKHGVGTPTETVMDHLLAVAQVPASAVTPSESRAE